MKKYSVSFVIKDKENSTLDIPEICFKIMKAFDINGFSSVENLEVIDEGRIRYVKKNCREEVI